MYKNKAPHGRNNLCGVQIRKFREQMPGHPSQKQLADLLQVAGLDIDKNAIQRIESGQRFVTDIELRAFVHVLGVSYEELLENCSL